MNRRSYTRSNAFSAGKTSYDASFLTEKAASYGRQDRTLEVTNKALGDFATIVAPISKPAS